MQNIQLLLENQINATAQKCNFIAKDALEKNLVEYRGSWEDMWLFDDNYTLGTNGKQIIIPTGSCMAYKIRDALNIQILTVGTISKFAGYHLLWEDPAKHLRLFAFLEGEPEFFNQVRYEDTLLDNGADWDNWDEKMRSIRKDHSWKPVSVITLLDKSERMLTKSQYEDAYYAIYKPLQKYREDVLFLIRTHPYFERYASNKHRERIIEHALSSLTVGSHT